MRRPVRWRGIVERYLHDEPVEACPPSAAYRVRKFARKHRRLLATAGAFAGLLLVATAVSAWLAVMALQAENEALAKQEEAVESRKQATEERDRAQKEWRRAEDAAEQAKVSSAETRRALDRMTVAKGIQLADEGKLFAALPWFVKPLEHGGLSPEEEKIHRSRIACYLRHTLGRPTLRQIFFDDGPVTHAAWSADGKRVLTVSKGVVTVRNVRSGETLTILRHPGSVTTAQFTPDGTRVLAVAMSSIWMWDVTTGQPLGPPFMGGLEAFPQHPLLLLPRTPLQLLGNIGMQGMADSHWRIADGSYLRFQISRDGRRALFAYKQLLRLLDLETRKPIQQWFIDSTAAWSNNCALSPNGQTLLLIKRGLASAYDSDTGKMSALSVDTDGPVESVVISGDGTRALTVGKDGTARV